MAKILTYNQRNPNASSILSFGTPEGTVTLSDGIPVQVEDSVETYLKESQEEYQLCVKREIITVKDVPESPGSTLTEISNPELGEESVESNEFGEVIVPKSSTTKTTTTKK